MRNLRVLFLKISKNIFILFVIIFLQTKMFAQQSIVIKIFDENRNHNPASEKLYGSFVELGFGRSDNITAELLYNGDFEESKPVLGQPWVVFGRPKIEQEDWWHSGYEESKWQFKKNEADVDSKSQLYYENYWPMAHGKYFMQVSNSGKFTEPVLFTQSRVFIKAGQPYLFSGLFSNGNNFSSEREGNIVNAQICIYKENDFNTILSETNIAINFNQFNEIRAELPAMDYTGFASFAIKILPKTNLSFDKLSLMPSDNIKGFKKEAIAFMRDTVPASLVRFPGGCFASFYNWRDGIGNKNERPVNYETWWGNVLVNDVGTAEFIDLCNEIKAAPFFAVPVMIGTSENARDWVDYCNNPNNALRIKHGYKNPFNVKYWELDNETYRKMDGLTYAHKCVEFSKQMKQVDPSIKIAIGNYYTYHSRFKEMLKIAGPYIDLITNRAGDVKQLSEDVKTLEEFNKLNNTNIKLCHTEFRAPLEFNSGGVDGLNRLKNEDKETMFNRECRWAYGLSMLEEFIAFQNFGNTFFVANFTNYSDGWGENLINISKEKIYLSAAGRAFQLLNKLPIYEPQKYSSSIKDSSEIIQIAWNKDKTKLVTLILNFDKAEKSYIIDLGMLNKKFNKKAMSYQVFAQNKNDFNTTQNPNNIKVIDKIIFIGNKNIIMNSKPFSATAVVIDLNT